MLSSFAETLQSGNQKISKSPQFEVSNSKNKQSGQQSFFQKVWKILLLLHPQSIVCATVDSQSFRVLGIYIIYECILYNFESRFKRLASDDEDSMESYPTQKKAKKANTFYSLNEGASPKKANTFYSPKKANTFYSPNEGASPQGFHDDSEQWQASSPKKAKKANTFYNPNEEGATDPNQTSFHECPLCYATFSQKTQLSQHISLLHCGLVPHSCNFCEAKFVQKHHLKAHIEGMCA